MGACGVFDDEFWFPSEDMLELAVPATQTMSQILVVLRALDRKIAIECDRAKPQAGREHEGVLEFSEVDVLSKLPPRNAQI
jgi:hypothetical protein